MKAQTVRDTAGDLNWINRRMPKVLGVLLLSLSLPCGAIESPLGSWLHHSAVKDYAHLIWSFQIQITGKRNLQWVPRLAHLHVLKTKRPGLETSLVSRPGLRNPRAASRFAFRTATKILTRRQGNCATGNPGLAASPSLNESPHPEVEK